ncbi:hypothetical protein F0H33_19080 [Xanthomonas translucens pv. undulosa]|nr:hypothetical protein F0H33_19080 [Xanthomonas translucens pv. undulosa]
MIEENSGLGTRDSGLGIRDLGFGIRDSGFGMGWSATDVDRASGVGCRGGIARCLPNVGATVFSSDHLTPWCAISCHGVESDKQYAHACGDGDLGGLAACP